MADIFDEIAEDLRAERARTMLRRYGALIIAVMVLVLAGVIASQGWRWQQGRLNARVADAYFVAMTQADAIPAAGDPEKRAAAAKAFLAVAADAQDGYRTLARLRAAGLEADGGDRNAALVLWDQVAADGNADPLIRDLASLLWVQHQADAGDPAALAARLAPLTRAENPWRALAQEQMALLDLRRGKLDDARGTLKQIAADISAPEGVRGRANGLLAGIGG